MKAKKAAAKKLSHYKKMEAMEVKQHGKLSPKKMEKAEMKEHKGCKPAKKK